MSQAIIASEGFTNISPLGQGAFGSIFRCTSGDGRELAVKISTSEHTCQVLGREAEIMAVIPAHINVLPMVSYSASTTHSILVMPVANGTDSLKLMQERGCVPLAEVDAHTLFVQLLDAVEHLHSNGIVHRDIKCENILLTGVRRRNVLLADFGFATRYQPAAKLTEDCGSLHYSSPEICSQVPYMGPEVDVWSMGVVLYVWTTGRLPFGGNTVNEITARINSGCFTTPRHCSPELVDLFSGILNTDSTKRLSVPAIRQHPWFTAHATKSTRRRSNSEVHKATIETSHADARHSSCTQINEKQTRLTAVSGLLQLIFHRK